MQDMIVPLSLVALTSLLVVLFIAALSRHKKSAPGALKVIGATGQVDSTLAPEGSVIINGELWRARIEAGVLPAPARVRVIGLHGHLLLVAPLSEKL